MTVVSLYRIEHLGLNVVLQLLVGVPLEMVHGATRIGLVYVAGVVAGRQVGPEFIGVNLPRAADETLCRQAGPRLPADAHHPGSRLLGFSSGYLSPPPQGDRTGMPPRGGGV